MKRITGQFFGCCLLLATLAGNGRQLGWLLGDALRHIPPGKEVACSSMSDVDDDIELRRLVLNSVPSNATLKVVPENGEFFSPSERYLFAGIVFDRLPRKTETGRLLSSDKSDALVVPNALRKTVRSIGGFRRIGSTESVTLFVSDRTGSRDFVQPRKVPSSAKELMGMLVVVCPALFVGVFRGIGSIALAWYASGVLSFGSLLVGIPPSPFCSVVLSVSGAIFSFLIVKWPVRHSSLRCLAVPAILSFVYFAMSFPLSLSNLADTPGAVSSVGGRARLFVATGAVPVSFFSDPAWTILQPSYPPGFTVLAELAFGISGVFSDWAFQAFPAIGMSLLLFEILLETKSGFWRFAILALFWTPLSFQLASQCYPETLGLFCLATGIGRIKRNPDEILGWVLLGGAGWFKNECGVLAFFSFIVLTRHFGAKKIWRLFVLSFAIPVGWHLLTVANGGGITGWGFPVRFESDRWCPVWSQLWNLFVGQPQKLAFLIPLFFALLLIGLLFQSCRFWLLPSGFLMLSVFLFGFLYVFSKEPDIVWHVATSYPRLVWDSLLAAVLFMGFQTESRSKLLASHSVHIKAVKSWCFRSESEPKNQTN